MWPVVSIGIAAVIVLLGILLVWKISKDRRSGFPARDERTAKITGKAATYALYVGSYFIIALLFAFIIGRELYNWPEIDAGYPLIAALLVYNLTFAALSWYFSKKGDL